MSEAKKITSFEDLTIDEVTELVSSGRITALEALEAEKQGKNRSTLISALEKLVKPPETQSKTVKVVFTANTKHNSKRYVFGQTAEVFLEDFDILQAAKVIKAAGE